MIFKRKSGSDCAVVFFGGENCNYLALDYLHRWSF